MSLSARLSILPLVRFRVLFGLILAYGIISSICKGEISARYTSPSFFFKYYGFDWVGYIGDAGIYWLHGGLILAALMISLGFLYRFAVAFFGLGFTYLHLLDSTNYINHYYLISLLCGLMFFAPAHRYFSLDLYFFKQKAAEKSILAAWYWLLQFQVGIVYFFAGLAKLNSDWLQEAMPLRVWFLQFAGQYPTFAGFFSATWAVFLVSWGAAFYDLTIWAFLLWRKSRKYAYIVVLGFHLVTGLLFDIGLFPIIMPAATLLFFTEAEPTQNLDNQRNKWILFWAIPYIILQIFLPLRAYFWYSGNILWKEEGYRWAWRVMLVEKEGQAVFTVSDTSTGRFFVVENRQYLSAFQEKRLIQPDHIIQFAHFLAKEYARTQKIAVPVVKADVRVVLNARRSRMLVDTSVDLSRQVRDLSPKTWLLD
jgi:hypothetical protein